MALNEMQKASRDQFEKQSKRYGRSHILADTSDIVAACEFFELPENAKVLDVATGGGHAANYFAAAGCDVIASDITPAMLENAGNLARENGNPIGTGQHSAEELPYADSHFDLVVCRVAPHHFSDVSSFVRESCRVLKSGGTFLVIDGSVPDNNSIAEAWTHQVEKLRDPSHGRFISPGEWQSLCGDAGLSVHHCELKPMKMPDLEWYFETAATPQSNRTAVLELVRNAPEEARDAFKLGEEDEKIVWWWQRMTLVARAH